MGNLQFYLNERGRDGNGRAEGAGWGWEQATKLTRPEKKKKKWGEREIGNNVSKLPLKTENKQTKPTPTNLRNRKKFKNSIHLCLGVSGYAERKSGKPRLKRHQVFL